MKILIIIYNPVDLFPPSINAVEQLAARGNSISLLTNELTADTKWVFPENVTVTYNKNPAASKSRNRMIGSLVCFATYYFKLKRILRKQNFDLVLLYEPHAALAYKLLLKQESKKKHVLWYHNHDIYELSKLGKYTLAWFAAKAEQGLFPYLSLFTLPADERKAYFPMDQLKGRYFFLPNYPSVKLYSQFRNKQLVNDEVRLLYQGRISPGHGLEQLLELLPSTINNKRLTLHVKGTGDNAFIDKLKATALKLGVTRQLSFYELSSYLKVPELAVTCHIGIGIHTDNDIMHATLGTSSNKIYEYAAAGLPVLLFDNKHFREHLSKHAWAFFTDCSKDSLISCISEIMNDFQYLSVQAEKDFKTALNFENYFNPVMEYVSGKLNR